MLTALLTTCDIDDLRTRLQAELQDAALEQERIQRFVDDLLAAAPHGFPLGHHETAVIRAGAETQVAFEELQKTVNLFLMFTSGVQTWTDLPRRDEYHHRQIEQSGRVLASARASIKKSGNLIKASCALIQASAKETDLLSDAFNIIG